MDLNAVVFGGITLFHLLLIVGIPYIIFYFFHLLTDFDHFESKWEGLLFVFSIGGTSTYLSLLFCGVYRCIIYFLCIFAFVGLLWLFCRFRKEKEEGGWVMVETYDKVRYKGILKTGRDFFTLKRSKKKYMVKIKKDKKGRWTEEEIKETAEIAFNKKDIKYIITKS